MAYKVWIENKSLVELRLQYSEARKAAATKVKLSKERAWKEFAQGWTMISKRQTKYAGRPFAVCVEKDVKPLFSSAIHMVSL